MMSEELSTHNDIIRKTMIFKTINDKNRKGDIFHDKIDIEDENLDHSDNEQNEMKKKRKEVYGKGYEAKTIKEKLGDFNLFESNSYKIITKEFGKSIRFNELLGILNSINIYLKLKKNINLPKITRDEKRSFPLLIKYIEHNNEFIYPYLQYINLCNSSFQKIPLDIE